MHGTDHPLMVVDAGPGSVLARLEVKGDVSAIDI